MTRLSLERWAWRAIIALFAVSASAVAGIAVAGWATGDANGFYMAPIDRYGTPAHARRGPVADSFWDTQGRGPGANQAGTTSTATSAQPAYRSASGS